MYKCAENLAVNYDDESIQSCAIDGIISATEKEIDRFQDCPEFFDCFDNVKAAVLDIVDEIELNPPVERVELGKFCHQIGIVLEPAFENLQNSTIHRKEKVGIFKEISRARKNIADIIIFRQKERGRWREESWQSPEMTISNVREIIRAYLGIPNIEPMHGGREWTMIRSSLIAIRRKDFSPWGLESAVSKNNWFSSYIDLLIEAFPEYDLIDLKKRKHKFSYSSREQTLKNVREVILAKLKLPAFQDQSVTKRLISTNQLISIKGKEHFNAWGLRGAWNTQWFNSHIDAIIAAFPEYELKRWYFTNFGRIAFKTAVIDPTARIKKEDRELIDKVLADTEGCLEELVRYVYAIPVRSNSELELNEQKSKAFEKVLENIRVMGEECPISIEVLWKMANSYARVSEKLSKREQGIVQSYNENWIMHNEGGCTYDLLDFERFLDSLIDEKKVVVHQYVMGEIDLEDSRMVGIITGIQETLQTQNHSF